MPHYCIVVATFYEDIAQELLQGAIAELTLNNATHDTIHVPGAFEIPSAISMAIASKKYDGYIALGCVIRGETTHYDYVCSESARGLNELAIVHHAPIGFGILTVENSEQAWERAAVSKGNKGKDAVIACLHLHTIKKEFALA